VGLPPRPVRRPACPRPRGIRLALPVGRPPGRPQRGCRAPSPAPGTPGSVSARPARLSLIPGQLTPDRIRTPGPPDPARSMARDPATRLRNPGHIESSGKPGGRSTVCGGCGQPRPVSGCPGARAVFEPPRTPPSVVGGGRGSRADFCHLVFWHLADSADLAVCPAFLSCLSGRGCLCREPAPPARHGALRSGDRGDDRGGGRARLRDGIGQACAGCPLPAAAWPLRRSRAGCNCWWAGR
jgi:hypothetical protein